MYNGIGVQTARGTGTSGHVMKNIGSLRPFRHDIKKAKELAPSESVMREADPGILHHQELRRIEVFLAEYRESLEDSGWDERTIDVAVATRRAEMKNSNIESPPQRNIDSHALAVERGLRDDRLAEALDVKLPALIDSQDDKSYRNRRSSSFSSNRSRSPIGRRNR